MYLLRVSKDEYLSKYSNVNVDLVSNDCKVLLNIEVDDISCLSDITLTKNVFCISVRGNIVSVPANISVPVYWVCDLSAYTGVVPNVKGVTPLIELPNGYNDLYTVYTLCKTNSLLRVIGGNLLAVKGIRVGRIEDDTKLNTVFNGKYDYFKEVSVLDNIEECVKRGTSVVSDVKKVSNKKVKAKKSSKSSKPKTSKPKIVLDMFDGLEDDF